MNIDTFIQSLTGSNSSHPALGDAQAGLAADGNVVLHTEACDAQPLRVQLSGNQSTLAVQDGGGGAAGLLSVIGPSGRGPYQLQASPEVSPFGIGCQIYHDAWVTAPAGSLEELKLSISHDDVNDGYWMAWRDEEDGAGAAWGLYWVTPLPYNEGDLEGGIQVGLVLRREG